MSRPGSWYSEDRSRSGYSNGYPDDLLPQFATPANRQLPLTPSHPPYDTATSPTSLALANPIAWAGSSTAALGGDASPLSSYPNQQHHHHPAPPPSGHSLASSFSLARSASLGGSRKKDPFGNQMDDVEAALGYTDGSGAGTRGSWTSPGRSGAGGSAGYTARGGGQQHAKQTPSYGTGRMVVGELYPSSMTGEGLERTGLAAPPSDASSPLSRRAPLSPGSHSSSLSTHRLSTQHPPPPPPAFYSSQQQQQQPPSPATASSSSTAASVYNPYMPRSHPSQPPLQQQQQQQQQFHSAFTVTSSSNPSTSNHPAVSPARGPRPPSSRPPSQVGMSMSPLPRPPGAPQSASYPGRQQQPPPSPSSGSTYQNHPSAPASNPYNPPSNNQHPPPPIRSQSSQHTKSVYQPPPSPPSIISQSMSQQNSSSSYQASSSYSNSSNPYARQSTPTDDKLSSGFKRVRDIRELKSTSSRKAEIASPLKSLTTDLAHTYKQCDPTFRYELSHNPRRVLTKPDKGVLNDGHDNEDNDYILYVNDILGSDPAHRYRILDVLGQGTFGQVVKCQNIKTNEHVAVKVIKNKPAYLTQSKMEVAILEDLNHIADPHDEHNILRMRTQFMHHSHLCLVFECLSSNLYELIKQNSFRGLSSQLVKVFTDQLLDTLSILKTQRLIHCDLKPENILLRSLQSPRIKVIDFGSACNEYSTVYTYIQSRFYRSPEVLLGLPYSTAIDMWSLGCIAVELFLGLPLFPGTSEYNQLSRIIDTLGMPPNHLLEHGKQVHEYFVSSPAPDGYGGRGRVFRLKSMEQYSQEHNVQEQPSKQYFKTTSLPEMIKTYAPMKKGAKQSEIDKEMAIRESFIDFVLGCLNLDPIKRWSPQQARLHPFITGEKFKGHFTPSGSPQSASSSSSRNQSSPVDPSRPYGGLVSTPTSSRPPVYTDAASYNRQLAQHQTYTAQQQAAQAQASAYKHPFAPPPPLPTQSQSNQEAAYSHSQRVFQSQQAQAHAAHVHAQTQAHAQAQAQAHSNQQARLPTSLSTSGLQPSPYSTRNSTGAILPPPAVAHSSSTAAAPPNAYYPLTGRNRANTINQMDAPPHLARLTNLGVEQAGQVGRSALTPVLNRDEMMQEWERRNTLSNSGKRASVNQTWPQLEFLEAESLGWAGGAGHSSKRYAGGGSGAAYGLPSGGVKVEGNRTRQGTASTAFGTGSDVYMGPSPSPGAIASSIMTPPQAYSGSTTNANRYAQFSSSSTPFDAFDPRHDGMGTLVQPLQPSQAGGGGSQHQRMPSIGLIGQQQQHYPASPMRSTFAGNPTSPTYDSYGQQVKRKQSANTLGEGWR